MKFKALDELQKLSGPRAALIDAARGNAILLVVLGHAIQSVNTSDFDGNIVFRYIYSFHMPLFMFASGYIAFFTFHGRMSSIARRFVSLMVPFFAWSAIQFCVYERCDPAFLTGLIQRPDTGLWFLLVLFEAYVLLFLARLFKYENMLLVIFFCILYRFAGPYNVLGVGLLRWHFFFFCLGFFVSKYKKHIGAYSAIFSAISIVLFPVLAYFWRRGTDPGFVSFFSPSSLYRLRYALDLYRYAVPITGIACMLAILKYINGRAKLTVLAVCGLFSIEIYVLHLHFIRLFAHISHIEILNLTLSFIGSIACSFATFIMIKQSAVLNLLLFGKMIPKRV